jgi:tetratricopeptide (TPR) repeat protein
MNENEADKLSSQAFDFYNQGQYVKAIELISSILNHYPGHWDFLKFRFELYTRNNEFENAIKDLNELMEMNPGDAGFINNKIAISYQLYLEYFQEREFHKALTNLNVCLNLDSSNPLYYINRSALLIEMEDYKSAIEAIKKEYSITKSFETLANLAQNQLNYFVKMKSENNLIDKDGLKILESAFTNFSLVLSDEEYITKCSDDNSAKENLFLRRGICRYFQSTIHRDSISKSDDIYINDAVSDFNKAIAINPNSDGALYRLAQCQAVKLNYKLAIETINRSLLINPTSKTYQELKDFIISKLI